MEQYQKDFVEFTLDIGALKFGEFTLKSGRVSPYFFNAGMFNKGKDIAQLGQFYVQAIHNSKLNFNVLFGPAYKGIPLTVATTIAFNNQFDKNIAYSFNRKESKTYGEGGNIVGSQLKGDILIIDDVITKGTAIYEAINIINANNATTKGVVVALNRQEKGNGDYSVIQELEQSFNIKVISIINLSHLISYLQQNNNTSIVQHVKDYRNIYGDNS